MNSLLKLATEAHGGVDRWNRLKSLKADLSVTGGIWYVKGRPDVLKDIRIECPLHEERLTTHLVGQNKRFVFTPHQVSVEDEQGRLVESRDDPRRAFEGQTNQAPWNDLHIAYFDSYALWTYLTIPFLYTYPGFITHALAKSLPFGGIGHSGMGAYGGKAGFLTFSHTRSIYRQGKSSKAELALRPPFTPAFQASLTEAINRSGI